MTCRSPLLLTCLLCFPPLLTAAQGGVQAEIQRYVEQIQASGDIAISGQAVASVQVLPALYEQHNYQPLWTHADSIKQLFDTLDTIHEDGLDAADYHTSALKALRAQVEQTVTADPTLVAKYDILLTDSLIRLGYHLLVGKVDPVELDNHWNMEYTIGDLDTTLELATAIERGGVSELVDQLRPQAPIYANLKAALARYRDIQARGGWEPVSPGPTLKPGMTDARVAELRKRLTISGDMPSADLTSGLFDDGVEAGVKKFQRRHGLEADGLVGKGTLAAMNVGVEARIDQIRVNLERARWVLRNLPDEYVLTDIAGFKVTYVRDGEVIWQSRAQVGKPYRKTPVFRSEITYLDINPTWTVPPTILRKDIIPKLQRDPGYLKKKDMQVLQHTGKPVDASTIDWSKYSSGRFPYMIRQNPGPQNALGRIKFMFPNEHAVYLHDTPSKSLFGRTERAFSSGCIRVENPYDFAVLLLKSDRWNRDRILEVVDSQKTTSVRLPAPVTVILLYWTVNATADDPVVFKKDIYNRDGLILTGLNRPFRFRKGPILDKTATTPWKVLVRKSDVSVRRAHPVDLSTQLEPR
jgi:murein L,D-transpeptidase YcbB/YkuD